MSTGGVLVAGIGNIFLGDDGFGVEVVRRLARRGAPAGARVVDFGIRGQDLALALMDGYDAVVLVDAARRGGEPGTLYLLEPLAGEGQGTLATLGMDPARVLAAVRATGAAVPTLRLVACEPGVLPGDDDDLVEGLSPAVLAAVDPACALIERVVAELAHA